MFENWENFYLLIGSAAAALIGLLFVVATLTTGIDRSQAARGASVYMTPTVFHFGVVLTVSAVAMTPKLSTTIEGAIIALAAAAGLAQAVYVAASLTSRKVLPDPPHWSDLWLYAVAPGAVYLGVVAAAVFIWTGHLHAAYAVAAATMVLLLVAIRNAWDLVTSIAAIVRA
ncbi:MAG: hypothetical protein WDM92_10060 [Caulobacteraceae bacterium]